MRYYIDEYIDGTLKITFDEIKSKVLELHKEGKSYLEISKYLQEWLYVFDDEEETRYLIEVIKDVITAKPISSRSFDDKEFNKYCKEVNSYEYGIFDFDRKIPEKDFIKQDPTENGHYLTIRLGLSGIYTSINYWKNGNWMAQCLDGSSVVARTRNSIKNLDDYYGKIGN